MTSQSNKNLEESFNAQVVAEKASIEQSNLTQKQLIGHLAAMRVLSRELSLVINEQTKTMLEASHDLESLAERVPDDIREILLGYTREFARIGANARHNKPGGSREKQDAIRQIWASGKYSSRDICAEQESAALGMSFSSARKALRGTPNP